MGSQHHRQVTAIEAGTHAQASGHSPTGSPSLGKCGLDPVVDPTDTLHVQQGTSHFLILRAGAPAVQKGCRKRSSQPAGCCSKARLAAPEPPRDVGLGAMQRVSCTERPEPKEPARKSSPGNYPELFSLRETNEALINFLSNTAN